MLIKHKVKLIFTACKMKVTNTYMNVQVMNNSNVVQGAADVSTYVDEISRCCTHNPGDKMNE